MRQPRLLPVFALLFTLVVALAACGGDDALSDQEYFAQMTELDGKYDPRFEETPGEASSAREGVDAFVQLIREYSADLEKIKPPKDVEEHHSDLIGAIGEAADAVEEAGSEFDEDTPLEEFESVFGDDKVTDAIGRADQHFCDIQALADEKNITADVGCPPPEEEAVDPSTLPPEETTEVLIQDFAFDPPHIQVTVGDTVTWTQGTDAAPHTATADDGTFDSGNLTDEGETFEFTFEEAGEVSYFCEIHPDMLGLVTVVE